MALVCGLLVAIDVYILVAPFQCHGDGTCDGLVAFHYQPHSAGHWQALGAAGLVGAVVALLAWLVLGRRGRVHWMARIIATPLLVAGIGVSLLSQSVLLIAGPLVGAIVLWLMWGWEPHSPDNSHPEPSPFSSES